jgi:hypothetical protein
VTSLSRLAGDDAAESTLVVVWHRCRVLLAMVLLS